MRLPKWVLVLMSVSMLVLSQSPYELGVLATVALIPWLIATGRSGPASAFLMSVAMGIGYAVTAANWLFPAFRSQGAQGIHGVIAVLLTALWGKGLLFGVIGWCVQRLRRRSPIAQILIPAALFGLAEYEISDSSWGLPLLLLGHSQLSMPGIAQLAVAVGVPGISMFLFAMNVSFTRVLVAGRIEIRAAVVCSSIWFAMALGGLPISRAFDSANARGTKTLVVVQPNIPPAHRWDPAYQATILDEISAETTRAIANHAERPDAILWPENLLTLPVGPENSLGRQLQGHVDAWRVPVVTGLVRENTLGGVGRYRNSAVWWSPRVGLRDAIDKVRAIPIVESGRGFPGHQLVAGIIGEAAMGPRVEEATTARPLAGEFTISPVLCFEVLFPQIVAARRNDESVAIVNLADDSWVPSEVVDAQLIAAASFRAIEQRLTLIRVSHGGQSVVIDRFGKKIASLASDRVGHLIVEVSPAPAPSTLEKVSILVPPVLVGLMMSCLTSRLSFRSRRSCLLRSGLRYSESSARQRRTIRKASRRALP